MRINRNGKQIKMIDRRTQENASWRKGGRVTKRTSKALRTHPKGSQRAKILFACSLIPMLALFCKGYVETRDAMTAPTIENAEEVPEPIKFEELSVVNKTTEEVEVDLFVKYFGDEANIAKAIAQAESGMRPDAISKPNWNGTIDQGLMQINSCHKAKYAGEDIFDKEVNLRIAKQIRDSWEGWHAWTVFNSGAYKKYL